MALKKQSIRSNMTIFVDRKLISKEEWLRTTDHENYLIGTESTNDDLWSYNSKDSLKDFLKDFPSEVPVPKIMSPNSKLRNIGHF